jgi:hypothetical protein
MTDHQDNAAAQDVFDIANWLERAGRRDVAPVPVPVALTPVAPDYVPRHRADVGVDSVA